MDNIERNMLNKQYPELNGYSKRILLESKEQIDNYKNGEKVEIDNQQLPIELLKRIIEDNEYYQFALNLFNRDFIFRIGAPRGKEITSILHYEKDAIVKGIKLLLSNGTIPNQEKERERLNKIEEAGKVTIERIKELYGEKYKFTSNKKEYLIPCDLLFSKEEFSAFVDNEELKELYGIPKEIIIEAMPEFIRETLARTGNLLKKVEVSPELREAIFDDACDDYSILELSAYIYIKTCKNLTYNDEFYVFFDDLSFTEKFTSYEKLRAITPKKGKNKIICSQHALMYARFLHELGVCFSPEYLIKLDRKYGTTEHSYLRFTIDEYSVYADATSDFVNNDLANAKLNSPLTGFTCHSKNEDTIRRFEEMVNKIYKRIKEKEKSKTGDIHSLVDLKMRYIQSTNNLKPVEFEERIEILIRTINMTNLTGLDSFSFLIKIMELCFRSEHLFNNIRIAIIRNLETKEEEIIGTASAIISINQKGFLIDPENTVYYLFDPGEPVQPIKKEVLQEKCDDGIVCIANSRSTIPGIIASRLKEGLTNDGRTKGNK